VQIGQLHIKIFRRPIGIGVEGHWPDARTHGHR
jgi:hypothetical protein